MPLIGMTPEKEKRHIAHLARILRKRKAFTFGSGDTDRAFIRRRMALAAMTLAYLAWWNYVGFRGYWFREDAGPVAGYLLPVAVILWTFLLIRYLVKAHLGLKVLDRHGVDSLYQLPEEGDGGAGNGGSPQATATPSA